MKHQNGFTLIELLVVIAIIGTLSSIMFPVFSSARESARQTVCLSNMHQLGIAIAMQSADDGYYPGADWNESSMSYIKNKSIYICPTDPDKNTKQLSYELNELLADKPEGSVRDTTSIVLLVESGVDNGLYQLGEVAGTVTIPLMSAQYPASSLPNPLRALHNGNANVLFADSHADSMRHGQLTSDMFTP